MDIVQENIKNQLLLPFKDDGDLSKSFKDLRKDRKLLNIFYSFVDNDNSLQERSKEVYMNGFVWSTTADVSAISLFFLFIYVLAYVFNHQVTIYIVYTIGCLLLFLCGNYLLLPLITKKHISLSNEQLEFIATKYKTELYHGLKDLVVGSSKRL